MQRSLHTWIKATRPQFFIIMVLPILLGTTIAWREYAVFSPLLLLLSLIAGILIHAATNVLNDYFDHRNQADEFNLNPLTPYAGGSRMIQNKILTPNETYYFGLILLVLGIMMGLLLVNLTGTGLLWLGLIGVVSAYFYSAPPLALHSRGIGELLVGLNFGILTVLGAYYVQTQSFDSLPIIAAMPIACLIAAILYLNEFPDYESDKQAGKNTLVVRLGLKEATVVYASLMIFSFFIVVLGFATNYFPAGTLVSMIYLYDAVKAIQTLYQNYNNPPELVPAIKSTLEITIVMNIILIVVFYLPENSCFA